MEYIFEGLANHPKVVVFMRRWHIFFPLFESPLNTQILVSVQMIFSVIFCVFCFVLLYDQLKNVWYDRTYIEESNGQESGKGGSFYDSLVETMGEPFCLNWFLPRPGKNIDSIIRSLSIEVVQVEDSHEKRDWFVCLKQSEATITSTAANGSHIQSGQGSDPMYSKPISFSILLQTLSRFLLQDAGKRTNLHWSTRSPPGASDFLRIKANPCLPTVVPLPPSTGAVQQSQLSLRHPFRFQVEEESGVPKKQETLKLNNK